MHVLFIEPSFPSYQRQFTRGLAEVGARVTGIGERPRQDLDDDVKGWLVDYYQVPSVVDEGALLQAVRSIQEKLWVDRLEATVEAHVLPAARVREACSIPGTSVHTTYLCRDKPAMKDALRAVGVACANSTGARSADDARSFAAEVGFPMILKPRSAAGAAGTYRADDGEGLEQAIRSSGLDQGESVAIEEFNEGHEGFHDTLTIGGRVKHEFVSHYFPNVLEAMRTRWISPYVLTSNRLLSESYAEVRELSRKVIDAFGIETSATHMEWFFGPKGLRFSEIACRPTGTATWDLYCAANEIDLYKEWASAVVHGRCEGEPSYRYSAGMIALRPDRDGTITGYEGLEKIQARYGEWVIDSHFPPPGSPTQPVEGGYMANAWMRMRHPDYDQLRSMFEDVGRTVRVYAR